MKKIEKYFDEFCEGLMCEPYEREKNIELKCERKPCSECPHKKIIVDWLLEGCEEPIKLTQFEYDLLDIYGYQGDFDFIDFDVLKMLKTKDYFKNVDKDMKIRDILENCEVINNE